MVAVKVTDWPYIEELSEELTPVVVEIGGGSKKRPLKTALAPERLVIVMRTFPEIVQIM